MRKIVRIKEEAFNENCDYELEDGTLLHIDITEEGLKTLDKNKNIYNRQYEGDKLIGFWKEENL